MVSYRVLIIMIYMKREALLIYCKNNHNDASYVTLAQIESEIQDYSAIKRILKSKKMTNNPTHIRRLINVFITCGNCYKKDVAKIIIYNVDGMVEHIPKINSVFFLLGWQLSAENIDEDFLTLLKAIISDRA